MNYVQIGVIYCQKKTIFSSNNCRQSRWSKLSLNGLYVKKYRKWLVFIRNLQGLNFLNIIVIGATFSGSFRWRFSITKPFVLILLISLLTVALVLSMKVCCSWWKCFICQGSKWTNLTTTRHSYSTKYLSHLYKMLKSGNGSKISVENVCSV